MSHSIHHHPTFLHYTPPGVPTQPATQTHPPPAQHGTINFVAPKDTQKQPVPQTQVQPAPVGSQPNMLVAHPMASTSVHPQPSGSNGPVVAKGDWTKDLVHLAKTAELK